MTGRRSRLRYRRSPHVVAYWEGGAIVLHQYATNRRVAGTALTLALLDYFSDWRDQKSLAGLSDFPASAIGRTIRMMCATGLLERSDGSRDPRTVGLESLSSWNPAAGFFHAATRDVDFEAGEPVAQEFLRHRLMTRPQPAPVKTYSRRRSCRLPLAGTSSPLDQVLRARRTWRRFGRGAVSKRDFAALLHLSFGVQHWIDQGALGRAMLRTSPSGGARHPLEAYVVIRNVTGIAAGVHHYAPDAHALVRLRSGRVAERITRYLPGQPFYASAAALVLMTAVFPRSEWQYPFPRAYRVVHLEAGHFCQTFLLVATALGLAPFCTAALADSVIERDLGIDGASEAVIYACGVGTRPPGVDWAPWSHTAEVPRVDPPASRKRR